VTEPAPAPARRLAVWLVPLAVLTVTLTALAVFTVQWQASLDEAEEREQAFDVERVVDATRDHLAAFANAASRAARLFSPSNPQPGTVDDWEAELAASRAEWRELVSLHYIELVDPAARDAFVTRATQEWGEDLVSGMPDGWLEGDGPRAVVSRGAPRWLLGLDFTDVPEVTEALLQATQSQLEVLTTAIPPSSRGLAGEPQLALIATDRLTEGADVTGYAVAVFVGPAVVREIRRVSSTPLAVELVARTATPGVILLGSAQLPTRDAPGAPVERTIEVPGVDALFQLTIVPSAVSGGIHPAPLGLAIGGTLAALLLAASIWVLLRSRHRALVMVDEAVAELRSSEERLQALVRHAGDVIVVVDPEGRTTFVSPSVQELLGRSPASLLGRPPLEGAIDDTSELQRGLANLEPGSTSRRQIDVRTPAGNDLCVELTVTNLVDDPAVAGFVINLHDVTDRRAYEELLNHQASHDPLTGLANRVKLADVFDGARDRSQAEEKPLAVLFIDLDRFKQVNDDYGHDIGDELLQQVARRLRAAVRTDDTAARVGGDEFVVICPGASEQVAGLLARRLTDVIGAPYAIGGHELSIGASVGVAIAHDDTDLDVLLREADRAMYREKVRSQRETQAARGLAGS
jgi:diguanylate cyclase (GGDEF)-like protein/PAS domain S-box-containing protein